MRMSLALTGLAALGAQAACKGRSAASSSAAAAAASGVDATGSGSTGSKNTTSSSSTTSSAAAASSTAASSSNVKVASTSVTQTAANSGVKGFNYGAFFLNYQAAVQNDFEYEFEKAAALPDTSGWNSARLYTMVQYGTTSDVIQAIPAAIATNTTLLLGMWISGGDAAITNEITALQSAISTYGTAFTDLVVGLSVGSEDLYRDANNEVGTSSAYLIECISKVRSAVAGTSLANVPIGHVDTYDSFFNSTNTAVIDAIDWVGFDGYPYWEKANANSIDDASTRFYEGYNKTKALAGDKPVWVTETGWPVEGDTEGQAVASAENARKYWTAIACTLIADGVNLWWYDLQEDQYGTATPDFGIFGAGDLGTLSPRYELSC